MDKKTTTAIIAVAVVGIAAIGGFFLFTNNDSSEKSRDNTDSTVNASESTPTNITLSENYKDGTYDADGTYTSPGGRESILLAVTIKNNKIESVDFTGQARGGESKQYQTIFADNFESMVIGKNINEVKLDKVSGSSLTSIGFNNALEKIKSEAKS